MTTYLIINKLGSVIYQSNNNNTASNESYKIRYLPLLVIKDLIKANLNDVIQYIKVGNKIVAFREQQNLLYIACTKNSKMPIALLQLHLKVMHNFIRFHYGPQWSFQNNNSTARYNSNKITIPQADLHTCLSQLPFINEKLSIDCCDALCSSEQVQVSDDLRNRLIENMIHCCNSAFNTPKLNYKQKIPFDHYLYHHNTMTDTTTYCWSYCYLFAREKIVAQCRKDHELPDEFIYFLKLSVSRYLQESMASQYNHTRTTIDNTTLPQNISNSTMTTSYDLTSPSSSTTNSSSQPSSLAYVYDANSNSMPFRIREKATSSVTVISSDLSFFSSTTQQHHSSPVKALDIHDRSSFDSPSMDDVSFLSSSLPPEDISSSDTSQKHQSLSMKNERTSSAPSSPRLRSRSHSFTNTTREDSSLKHMLSSLINGELSHLDQIEDVKLIRRWLKIDGHICLANLIFVLLSEGLSAVVIYRDEVISGSKSLSSSWKPTSSQVKRFKTSLKSCLSDFNTFLLTKEATHFTNISFAVTYPGLVHFIYFDKGIMTAPSLVDLNELDKNHELLHEVYEKYSTDQYKWFWPDEVDLKKLCHKMLELGLIYRHDSFKIKALEESVDHQYYFVYQKGPNHQELLAIYFTIIPTDRLWSMHQKLFYDISQRST